MGANGPTNISSLPPFCRLIIWIPKSAPVSRGGDVCIGNLAKIYDFQRRRLLGGHQNHSQEPVMIGQKQRCKREQLRLSLWEGSWLNFLIWAAHSINSTFPWEACPWSKHHRDQQHTSSKTQTFLELVQTTPTEAAHSTNSPTIRSKLLRFKPSLSVQRVVWCLQSTNENLRRRQHCNTRNIIIRRNRKRRVEIRKERDGGDGDGESVGIIFRGA